MTPPINLAHPDELRDYVWITDTHGLHIEPRIYTVLPELTTTVMLDAIDYATTEGPINYSRLAYYIETHLPEVEECGK
jgi:hypothetical protein